MSAEGETVRAEGAAIDAAATAAETAAVAANAAIAASATAAANAEQTAVERTVQLENKVGETVAAQEDQLSWLRTTTAEHKTALESQSSVLTAIAERQAQHEATMAAILERLTPPVSPVTETQTPEQLAAEVANNEATKVKAVETEKIKAQKRNRWI